jgi:ribosomal protein S18 acetylase RimI-like enzyme
MSLCLGLSSKLLGTQADTRLISSLQTRIVAFSPDAYPVFTALWNEAYPELKRTELEMRLFDMSPASGTLPSRWLAQHEGAVVGFGAYELVEGDTSGSKHQLHLFVLPQHRGRGIGSSLYRQVMTALEPVKSSVVRVWTREDREEGLRFLIERGFHEEMRTFHSSLDASGFDLSRLARYVGRLQRYGYEIKHFDELETDRDRNRKTHELFCEVTLDIPAPEPPQLPTFAEFEQKIVRGPELFSAYFIASQKGRYVGLCILLPKGRARHELYADTLGVKRNYRGRGIAQALSYKGIQYAKQHGCSLISADSFVENYRIAALLERLGFGNRTVWTLFSKSLASPKKV